MADGDVRLADHGDGRTDLHGLLHGAEGRLRDAGALLALRGDAGVAALGRHRPRSGRARCVRGGRCPPDRSVVRFQLLRRRRVLELGHLAVAGAVAYPRSRCRQRGPVRNHRAHSQSRGRSCDGRPRRRRQLRQGRGRQRDLRRRIPLDPLQPEYAARAADEVHGDPFRKRCLGPRPREWGGMVVHDEGSGSARGHVSVQSVPGEHGARDRIDGRSRCRHARREGHGRRVGYRLRPALLQGAGEHRNARRHPVECDRLRTGACHLRR